MKLLETLTFLVSAGAFLCGMILLFREGVPRRFRYYAYAAGCYMLEELWVTVNYLFGNGAQDGLVTVRLFGFFGCLCFLLSAKMKDCNAAVPKGSKPAFSPLALCAPAVLIALFAFYEVLSAAAVPWLTNVIGLVALSPAFFAAYFSMKHLLYVRKDASHGSILTDLLSLLFYAANIVYPILALYVSRMGMAVTDLLIALFLFGMTVLCGREGGKWKTRT